MARNDVFLNINALSPADAVVTGQQDMTAATVPELVLGDTPTFNFYFTDNTNVWPSWAGNAAYTVIWALSDAVSGDFSPAATTGNATPITGGWSVVLPLNAYDLVGLLNTKRVSQPYPVTNLWQQIRVADPSGNEVTRAMFWTPIRYRAISDTQNTESASPTGGREVTVDNVNVLTTPTAAQFYAANPVPTSALGSAANGELLIGNGTGFTKSTLTAGTGITVTNGSGSITIDASGAQETLTATVKNAESVAITKGQVVYLFGATGNMPSVKLAYNTSDATSAKTFGVVSSTSIAANGTGTVTCVGVVDGLNLGAYQDGDTVYLGATPGSITATKPYAPNHLVYVGIVERANAGNGELYVRVQNGYELDEIHDVQINSPRQSGQTLIYDNTTSLWKNARITAGSNIAVTNGDGSISIGFSGTLPVASGGTGVTTSTGSGSVVLSTSPTLTTPILGTPQSGTLSSCTGLPISTGVSGLGTNVATALGSAVGSAGAFVVNGGALGTPSSGTLTNATGLPVSSGISGLGTNVATALAVAVGSAGAVVVNGGALGIPSSGTLTNATGLPISSGVSGLGTNVATFLATPSSANLASAVTDETGTGALVFANTPTLVTPNIGAATGTSVNLSGAGTIGGNLTVSGADGVTASGTPWAFLSNNGSLGGYAFYSSGASADQKYWQWQHGSAIGDGTLRLRALNDALSNGTNALVITRTGISSTAVQVGGNLTVSGTGTSSVAGNLTVSGGSGDGELFFYNNQRLIQAVFGNLYLSRGWEYSGGDKARSTEASFIGIQNDGIHFWSDTGLTAGNAYTPTERLWLKTNGNVLIGTAADGGQKLQVNGTIAAGNGVSATGAGIAGFAEFSHASMFGTSGYALAQNSSGATFLNSASGQSILLRTNGNTTALTLDSSQAATFAGAVNANGAFNAKSTLNLIASGVTTLVAQGSGNDSYLDVPNTNNGSLYLRTLGTGSIILRTANTTALTLDSSQNATFAGNINAGGASNDADIRLHLNAAGTTSAKYAALWRNASSNKIFHLRADGDLYTAAGATITGAIAIGNTVQTAAAVASTHKVTISIGGSTYYLLATNV